MKSEKAEKYLSENGLGYPYTGYVTEQVAERTAELAEQEAEERMREELTRWNDPTEVLPPLLTRVLGRYSDGENTSVKVVYRHLTATERNWFWTDGINAPLDIDSWREIH